MAEIRKHNPEVGNAIAEALKAAMGESTRPQEPGRPRTQSSPGSQAPATTPTVINVNVTTTVVHIPIDDDRED